MHAPYRKYQSGGKNITQLMPVFDRDALLTQIIQVLYTKLCRDSIVETVCTDTLFWKKKFTSKYVENEVILLQTSKSNWIKEWSVFGKFSHNVSNVDNCVSLSKPGYLRSMNSEQFVSWASFLIPGTVLPLHSTSFAFLSKKRIFFDANFFLHLDAHTSFCRTK